MTTENGPHIGMPGLPTGLGEMPHKWPRASPPEVDKGGGGGGGGGPLQADARGSGPETEGLGG